jgi:arginase
MRGQAGFSRIISKTVNVIGVPINLGQPRGGVEQGPAAIRKTTLFAELDAEGWLVQDKGDVPIGENADEGNPKAKRLQNIGEACSRLSDFVYSSRKEGKFALTIGGDHSLGIGSVAGALRADPEVGVIWVDAHADINSPQTSFTGNVHGMPVSFLMGIHGTRAMRGVEWLEQTKVPLLLPSRIVYVGLRDIDVGEKKLIKELGIKAFTMHDIDRYGIGKVMEMAMDSVCGRVARSLHLSYDVDALDPQHAPGTGTTVYGGLTYREACYVAEVPAESGYLVSMDLAEVNPSLENTKSYGTTAHVASRLILAAMGQSLL